MNHLVFALTSPADREIRERISAVHFNFEAWTTDLKEKKIDVQHAVFMRARLEAMEADLAHWETIKAENVRGGLPEHTDRALRKLLGERLSDETYHAIRAQRIYFRLLLLELLNLEDAWQAEQDAKAAAKAAKENA